MNAANQQPENNCEKFELLIDDYLEGTISDKDKKLLDSHIAECANCSAYLSGTKSLIADLNGLPKEKLTMSLNEKNRLWEKLESGIDKEKYLKEKKSQVQPPVTEPDRFSFFHKYRYAFAGLAAVLLIAVIFYGVKYLNVKGDRLAQQNFFGPDTYWKVSSLSGNPLIGGVKMNGTDSIKEGQFILTNADSRAELVVSDIGRIVIEPNSKVIFVKGRDGENRILVEYGTINADMKPEQKSFSVEMPSAVATNRGGNYTLSIDSTGDGLVYVKAGKVDVQSPGRAAVVPAGNIVFTKRDFGVGTPFNENTSQKFKDALFNIDFGKCGSACVTTLIDNAKISDAVSLVNLIPKVDAEYKDDLYKKVSALVPPPPHITKDSLPEIDEEKINEWVDKIQKEVQLSVEKSLKAVELNLEQLKNIDKLNLDSLKELEELSRNWNFKIKVPNAPPHAHGSDSVEAEFDKEQFRKDMEDMQKELKENANVDKEQLKEEMNDLKEDLKEMQKDLQQEFKNNNKANSEEIRKEMEKAKEEVRKAMEELKKHNIRVYDSSDSTGRKHKIIIKDKDDKDNGVEIEVPEPPDDNSIPDEDK